MFESNCRVNIFETMEKKEFRVLVKHYYLRGNRAKETKEKLDEYYGTSSPSNTTVKKWMQEFKFQTQL